MMQYIYIYMFFFTALPARHNMPPPPAASSLNHKLATCTAIPLDGDFVPYPGNGTATAPRVTAGRTFRAGECFFFPHATHPATRKALFAALANPGPARDAVAGIAVPLDGDAASASNALLDGGDPLFARLWSWLRPSATWAGTPARPEPAWYLEARPLAWARHAEAPTVSVVEDADRGGSVVRLLADLDAGGEVCRDLALRRPGGAPAGRRAHHSLSSAAELVGRIPPARWVHLAEQEGLVAGVVAAGAGSPPPGAGAGPHPPPPPRPPAGDPRPPPPPLPPSAPVPVWTDYPLFGEWLDGTGISSGGGRVRFVRTAKKKTAAIVLTPTPVKDFLATTARVNQFPYEAALIRKDLLPQTLRAHWAQTKGGGSAPNHPPFFPAAYDLATEAAWALAEHAAAAPHAAAWALKPASAARSVGVCATASAATLAAFRAPGGLIHPADFIAQRVVTSPWTAGGGRKVDLRVLVTVRSFSSSSRGKPSPSASLYTRYHARLAPAVLPDDLGAALVAPGAFSTVSCYDNAGDDGDDGDGGGGGGGGGSGGAGPQYFNRAELDGALRAAGADPAAVQASLAEVARQVVLAGVAAIGGPWPTCAAFYGLDIMLCSDFRPHLLEVNFCPDLTTATSFRPSLPGDLLGELFGGEGNGVGGQEGVFVPLF